MKKILLFALSVTLLILSCNTDNDDGKREFSEIIKPFVEEKILGANDDIILNNIEVIRIDTSNEMLDTLTIISLLSEKQIIQSDRAKLQSQIANQAADLASLSKNMSQDLYDIYRNDAISELEKSVKESLEVQRLISRILKLDSLVKTNSLDSLTPTGYFVLFNIKATDKANVIKDIDSVRLPLDINKRIRDKKAMIMAL